MSQNNNVLYHSDSLVKTIAVIGLGLIGGSIAKGLARKNITVLGYDINKSFDSNYKNILFYEDLISLLHAAEKQSAIILIAVPLPQIQYIFEQIAAHTHSCIITDVTSIKQKVHNLAVQYTIANRFIGGHPMAGTENSGWNASRPDLFIGKKWVLTFDNDEIAKHRVQELLHIVTLLGAHSIIMHPQRHDDIVAVTSHLPHIFADIISIAAAGYGEDAFTLAASSFTDATRVALTQPELIQAMLEGNADALIPLLDTVCDQLNQLRVNLSTTGVEDFTHRGYLAKKLSEEFRCTSTDKKF